MKRTMAVVFGAALLVTGVTAQHEEHHPEATPPADKAAPGKMSQMPQVMMPEMMTKMQGETAKLVDQLAKSFAAIETEKDPVVLNNKLAEHGALLKGLQAKLLQQSQMMDQMTEMMRGHMLEGEHKK